MHNLLPGFGDLATKAFFRFGDELLRLRRSSFDQTGAVRTCLSAKTLAKLRRVAAGGVEPLLDLRGSLIEISERALVGFLRRARFRLSGLQDVVDRAKEKAADHEVVHDEDRHHREQREIGHQVDLHTIFGTGKRCRGRVYAHSRGRRCIP